MKQYHNFTKLIPWGVVILFIFHISVFAVNAGKKVPSYRRLNSTQ